MEPVTARRGHDRVKVNLLHAKPVTPHGCFAHVGIVAQDCWPKLFSAQPWVGVKEAA